MRILYLSQYFPPEVGATQTRAHEMARGLIQAGHQVTMIAEFPNHPRGVIANAYRGRLFERARLDGIDVIRTWVAASPRKTFARRMAFYVSYMLMATIAGLVFARGRYDVIYATSPPLFTGAAGLALSLLKRVPLVFEVRDLWPESAVALGELRGRRAIAMATSLEEACYRRAVLIVVVTRGILERLRARKIGANKLAMVPNGANTDSFRPLPERGVAIRAELGLSGTFVVVYAGILGVAQGLKTVLDAARRLIDERDIRFLFIGEGPDRAAIEAAAAGSQLVNVTFLGERPQAEMAGYYSAADVALVPLRDLEMFRGVLPSKMFEAWACECPIILSVDGEARDMLVQAGAGLHAPPEDSVAIAGAILRMKCSADERRAMGRNGRAFVAAHYSRARAAGELERLLVERLKPAPDSM
ncbi:MAG: glycosyltransferase family 4 protein [Gammaproteobacteria bacterium]